MRVQTIVFCGAVALGVSACGSSSHTAASLPSPPGRVSVSALIGPGHVAIDPSHLGAGPITLTVTNQAARVEELLISTAGSSHAIAHTQPISPQGTTQLVVDLTQGKYSVTAADSSAGDDAQRVRRAARAGTSLRVGRRRRGGGAALLLP